MILWQKKKSVENIYDVSKVVSALKVVRSLRKIVRWNVSYRYILTERYKNYVKSNLMHILNTSNHPWVNRIAKWIQKY